MHRSSNAGGNTEEDSLGDALDVAELLRHTEVASDIELAVQHASGASTAHRGKAEPGTELDTETQDLDAEVAALKMDRKRLAQLKEAVARASLNSTAAEDAAQPKLNEKPQQCGWTEHACKARANAEPKGPCMSKQGCWPHTWHPSMCRPGATTGCPVFHQANVTGLLQQLESRNFSELFDVFINYGAQMGKGGVQNGNEQGVQSCKALGLECASASDLPQTQHHGKYRAFHDVFYNGGSKCITDMAVSLPVVRARDVNGKQQIWESLGYAAYNYSCSDDIKYAWESIPAHLNPPSTVEIENWKQVAERTGGKPDVCQIGLCYKRDRSHTVRQAHATLDLSSLLGADFHTSLVCSQISSVVVW